MRADLERRVPVEAARRLARGGFRLDVHFFARFAIEADQPAVLRLGVDDVRITGINGAEKAVTAGGDEPVRVDDAIGGGGLRRAAKGEVVLRAAIDEVERFALVDRDPVKLRDRQVGHVGPADAAVPGFVEAAIVAVEQVIGVGRVDPHDVVVDMLVFLGEPLPGLAAVLGHMVVGVHCIDAIDPLWVGEKLLVILRPGGTVIADAGPALAAIGRAIGTAFLGLGGLEEGVDDVGVGGRDSEADAAKVGLGHALLQFAPGGTRVGGLPDGPLGAAVNHAPGVTAALIGGGVEHI